MSTSEKERERPEVYEAAAHRLPSSCTTTSQDDAMHSVSVHCIGASYAHEGETFSGLHKQPIGRVSSGERLLERIYRPCRYL